MFEIEVTHDRLTSSLLPPQIRERFRESRAITHLCDINWEEHCTECAWPQCYTSCDLYNPRNDGNCRRTINGFSPLLDARVFGGYVVCVKFRRWASITATCRLALRSVDQVARTERRLNSLALAASRIPNLGTIIGRPGLPSRAVRRLKKLSVSPAFAGGEFAEPTIFLIEVYNPSDTTVPLSLDISPALTATQVIPFKRLLCIEPGFHRIRVPFNEIRDHLAGAREASLALTPNILNPEDEGLTLFFGVVGFARDLGLAPTAPKVAAKKIKVMIWDLDNTVWNGTLIEDGPGKVMLRPGVREVIEALDGRGIVNSIASKNNEGAALVELERFGLRDFFVFPQINWGPKSESVRRITQSFNVGEDTIAFVDDQPFEREEVRAGNPKTQIYRHDELTDLLQREEFDVPVTEEARNRRFFYQTEELRKHAQEQSSGGYLEFLRQSNIRIHVLVASVAQIDRIHELVQRTNQMNFSGTRYRKKDLMVTLTNPEYECYLIDAVDKYGNYGNIGFAVVKRGQVPRVVDLAFSCRVQSKRVEHAVLIFLMQRYAALGAHLLEVSYRATDKNAQVAQVFSDLGFTEAQNTGSDFVYRYAIAGDLPKNTIVEVAFSDRAELLEPA